jgi:hypothetical protein
MEFTVFWECRVYLTHNEPEASLALVIIPVLNHVCVKF